MRDFSYYSGRDVTYPSKVKRPTLGPRPTAAEALSFANELVVYEREVAAYENNMSLYRHEMKVRTDAFRADLRMLYPEFNDTQFNVIYSIAYDDGHSAGYEEVAACFDKYAAFAVEFAAA